MKYEVYTWSVSRGITNVEEKDFFRVTSLMGLIRKYRTVLNRKHLGDVLQNITYPESEEKFRILKVKNAGEEYKRIEKAVETIRDTYSKQKNYEDARDALSSLMDDRNAVLRSLVRNIDYLKNEECDLTDFEMEIQLYDAYLSELFG